MNNLSYHCYGQPEQLYIETVQRDSPYSMTSEHFHPYYEMYYLHSGSRVYFIHDQTYSLQQGDLVLINKHILHKTLQGSSLAHQRTVLHFNETFFAHLDENMRQYALSPFKVPGMVLRFPQTEQPAIQLLIKKMIEETRQKKEGFERLFSIYLEELIFLCARAADGSALVSAQSNTTVHGKIFKIVRHINEHYGEDLNLSRLAQQFYISPYYLSRTFKDATGFTYTDYITLTRIKAAQRLLANTAHSISDISQMVGFDNFSHFGKTFKRITKLSPRDYRKTMS